jgi:hypothetical protein
MRVTSLDEIERRLLAALAHPRSAAATPELLFVREALRRGEIAEAALALETAEVILGIRTRVGA